MIKSINVFLALITETEQKEKFEIIFNTYTKLLMAIAMEKLHDYQLAEDAVSETYFYLAKNMDKIEDPVSERTKALLITVVKHVSIDMLRKRSYKNEVLTEHLSENCTGLDNLDMVDKASAICEALNRLPEKYLYVLLLKYAQGFDNFEIAALLNYTKANVDKLVSRGKKKLELIMREMMEDEI